MHHCGARKGGKTFCRFKTDRRKQVQEGLRWCGEASAGHGHTPSQPRARSCPSCPSSLHRRHPPSSFSLITPYPIYRSHRPHPLSALSPLALVALIVQCMAGMGRDMRMHGRYALIPPGFLIKKKSFDPHLSALFNASPPQRPTSDLPVNPTSTRSSAPSGMQRWPFRMH